MILSDTAIFEALDDGRLVIDPEPTPRERDGEGLERPYSATSVDLHLGTLLAKPRHTPHAVIDLGRKGSVGTTLDALMEEFEIDDRGYELEPGPEHFILGQTLEVVRLRLPADLGGSAATKPALAARVEGKSSRARFGLLVHFTAPTIHAGWQGRITLEMMCLGAMPLKLYPGLPICQLIIEEVSGEPTRGVSQFQHQRTPSGRV